MQIVQKLRGLLPVLVTEELDNIIATIGRFWLVEHKGDGTHGDVTCDSLVVDGIPITGSGSNILDNSVTNAKLADMPAGTIKGRSAAAGTGDPQNLSGAEVTTLLDVFTPDSSGFPGFKGLVPAPLAGDAAAGKFLRADRTWVTVAGGGGGGMNLDYLGDYAPGPVYNDGDIVIAADGIAYMCVVDGTTVPPVPWPGGGMAVNVTVDASYWVVNPHSALTNERVMSALANGYVKSTAGEPSTVAVIPLAEGGTGATTAALARTNLGVGSVGTLNLNGNVNTFLNGTGGWSAPAGVGVPSGSIIFFTTPCPAGYTRVAAWDGRYVRMGPSHTTGGAGSHAHGPGTLAPAAHTHSAGTYAAASHKHDSGTLNVASHTHGSVSVSISGTTGANGGHAHSGTTGGESNGSAVMDAGGDMNCVRAPHVHNFSTSTVADHTHSFSGSGSGATGSAAPDVTGDTGNAAPAVSGVSGPASVLGMTGATDAQLNNPLYVDFFACQKD